MQLLKDALFSVITKVVSLSLVNYFPISKAITPRIFIKEAKNRLSSCHCAILDNTTIHISDIPLM
jgi:hypothetical protein